MARNANLHAVLTRVIQKYFFNRDVDAPVGPLALNNESILAVNAAGTGTVPLIKANASDEVEIPAGVRLNSFARETVARTATSDGTGTGVISPGSQVIQPTSANANHWFTLPAPVPGTHIILLPTATGYEIRTNAPATVAINGGAEANAESAIGANVMVELICATTTNWIGRQYAAAGTQTAVQVAAA